MITAPLQLSVGIYRRYISPRKGFKCAFAAEHGRLSCSDWAVRVLQRKGGAQFLIWLPRRFKSCEQSHRRLQLAAQQLPIHQESKDAEGGAESLQGSKTTEKTGTSCGSNVGYCSADLGACCCSATP